MTEFRHNYRIYYEDTDAGGIVYYSNYFKFAERGRTEAMRELGFENSALRDSDGIIIVVRKAEVDYLASARLDDVVTVITEVTDVKNSSFWMQQTIETDHGVCCLIKILLVCIDVLGGRPKKIPDGLRKELESHRMLVH